MAERLARVRDQAAPQSMAYLNDRLLPILHDQLKRATDLRQQFALQFQVGVQLVNAGFAGEGLTAFHDLEEALSRAGVRLAPSPRAELRMRKGIAYLRLGEQENCLTHHNATSCLFPLESPAYHQFPQGSRGAIQVFTEQLTEFPHDLSARWLLNLACMTIGEWPQRVPAPWLIPPDAFRDDYQMERFPDVAANWGVDVHDLAGGCILDDFDNDGWIDLVASSWSLNGQLRFFRNTGKRGFTERTREAGLASLVSGLNIQQTDYNNDGWLDIWVPRGAWLPVAGRIPNSLLRNNGDGTFTDVTEEAGLDSEHPTQASAWIDIDNDGWLDVFIGNETWDQRDPDPCELYRNNRDGTFTECARAAGVAIERLVKGVAAGDFDDDGRPDLYLSCRDGANILFRNETSPSGDAGSKNPFRFTDVTRRAGLDEEIRSFTTWFFDYDNDGDEDLFVSGYWIRHVGEIAADYLGLPHEAAFPRLYRNQGDGTFTNVTAEVRLDRVCHTMGANFGDLDNDGWLDFYLGTGDPDFKTLVPNRMFRNAGGRFFQEVTASGGFGHLQKGHGTGFADLDHDGDQDVYMVMGGAFTGDGYRNVLFLNPGHGKAWLKVQLEGTRSNRPGIGARIKVLVQTPSGPRSIYKTVNAGGSFGSSPLRQEIGLGDATSVTALQVRWPACGLNQTLTGIELNRAYRIREGDDRAALHGLAHSPPERGSAARPQPHARL
jgi:hypothetical protein